MTSRWFRVMSLVVPPALVARQHTEAQHLVQAAGPALVLLWVVMAGALIMRFVEARDQRPRVVSPWDSIDLLTGVGIAMHWVAAGALLLAGINGWASLSVIGIFGFGAVYLAITWTALMGCGPEGWRSAKVVRSIIPEIATESEPLREELRVSGLKIPPGMRLFACGLAMKHGAMSRYAIGAEGSQAEVLLTSELGPAQRGEHRAPPMSLWFGDVLGLTRSPVVFRGETTFQVLPRTAPVDGVKDLLGSGGDAMIANPTPQFPTEGTFRIREYVPGDDTRRIHWVRSAQQDQLIVRLPDEVPPADPVVRLVLDNELPGMEGLSTRAPDELLDAMVRVWLGIAKALADGGTRVTLVTAVEQAGVMKRVERMMQARSSREHRQLGMRVSWQANVSLDQLCGRNNAKHIVVSGRPRRTLSHDASISWVVVPESVWTSAEPPPPDVNVMSHEFPAGSEENRHGHKQRERRRIDRMGQDRLVFTHLVGWTDWAKFSGDHVARPRDGRITLGVIP